MSYLYNDVLTLLLLAGVIIAGKITIKGLQRYSEDR